MLLSFFIDVRGLATASHGPAAVWVELSVERSQS
jgi:hypothetical protein